MKNLSNLSDESLLSSVKKLVAQEREVTLNVLHHLQEVEIRQLFAKLGFSSLYEYATGELGYTAASAHRRITSMRLLRALPEIESKIEDGSLPLSTLSQAQSFFKQESISSASAKRELLEKLENKTSREVEKVLVMQSSEPVKLIKERIKPISETLHHLSLTVDDDFIKKVEELKALLSHKNPGMSLKELFEIMVDESLAKNRVKAPSSAPKVKTVMIPKPVLTDKPRSRYIPMEIERRVWSRDNGECTYTNPETGKKCSSRHFLEYDHIKPYAMGGKNTEDNLRLRCRAHNRLTAIEIYGHAKVADYVSAIKPQ